MDALIRKFSSYSERSRIYIAIFILSVHNYITVYFHSDFLIDVGGWTELGVGILFTISSIGILATFVYIEYILKFISNYRLALISILITFLGVLGMAYYSSDFAANSSPILLKYLIAISFILYETAIATIYLSFDISLESVSEDSKTGGIRAIYLTIANIIIIFAPALAGYILSIEGSSYSDIYLGASIFLIPLFLIVTMSFKYFPKEKTHARDFLSLIRKFYKDKNLKNIYHCDLILMFFYAIMVVYTPLYLNNHIGFSWEEITFKIFPIMLLPFALLEIPLGKIADKWLGEKEMLITGFVIMAVSTLSVAFVESSNPYIWALVLGCTRIGASMVEIMTETYFFKHVDAKKSDFILFYRTASPVAYITTPILFGALIPFIGYPILFITTGMLVATGIFFAQELVDTK